MTIFFSKIQFFPELGKHFQALGIRAIDSPHQKLPLIGSCLRKFRKIKFFDFLGSKIKQVEFYVLDCFSVNIN